MSLEVSLLQERVKILEKQIAELTKKLSSTHVKPYNDGNVPWWVG
jgi:hypothetical protein